MKKIFYILPIFILLSIQPSVAQQQKTKSAQQSSSQTTKQIIKIAIVYSDYSKQGLEKIGVVYDEYFGYVKEVFDWIKQQEMNIDYEVITDTQVESLSIIKKYKLLVLPNMRCMSKKQVENVASYIQTGGKIFTCYTVSIRNENDEYATDPRDFALGKELGIKYVSWDGTIGKNTYMKRTVDENHPLWKNLPEFIRLYRYTTMVVSTYPEATVVAEWYDENKTSPSRPQENNAAIVITQNTVYFAEDIFAPENSHSKRVRNLIKNCIEYLLKGGK